MPRTSPTSTRWGMSWTAEPVTVPVPSTLARFPEVFGTSLPIQNVRTRIYTAPVAGPRDWLPGPFCVLGRLELEQAYEHNYACAVRP